MIIMSSKLRKAILRTSYKEVNKGKKHIIFLKLFVPMFKCWFAMLQGVILPLQSENISMEKFPHFMQKDYFFETFPYCKNFYTFNFMQGQSHPMCAFGNMLQGDTTFHHARQPKKVLLMLYPLKHVSAFDIINLKTPFLFQLKAPSPLPLSPPFFTSCWVK